MTKKDEARYLDALNWVLGCNGEWPERQPGQGPFYWRGGLVQRAGLVWDRHQEKYVPAAALAPQPAEER